MNSWLTRAACVGLDPEMWFPFAAEEQDEPAQQARRICASCPVQGPCLDEGDRMRDWLGIRGQLSGSQRRARYRARRRAA